ncbi:MAG: hypothetical protein KC535_00315 [Nanoarchaeota archaeon]|nr:hypothetical protein [Nanoarchaeota archaeon]
MSKAFHQYQEQAHRSLDAAFELLEGAYELSQDPKVLVSALRYLKEAQDACMNFVMYLENKTTTIESFLQLVQEHQSLNEQEQETIREVHRLCKEQEESDVEFRRKKTYVLCNDGYQLSTLTKEQVNDYLSHTMTITKKLLR